MLLDTDNYIEEILTPCIKKTKKKKQKKNIAQVNQKHLHPFLLFS